MNQNPLRRLMSQAVWLGLVSAVTFLLWVSAVHAIPGVEESGQTILAATPVSAASVPDQSGVGPAELATVTAIDPNSFPTPGPEEIATREAMLDNTYLPGPSTQPPAGQEVPGPVPDMETTIPNLAATPVSAALIPDQSSVGPAELATVTVIDPNSFPTPGPEEIATRQALLDNTYLPGPAQPPADQMVPGPVPNTETTIPNLENTVQSLIEKAPAQTGLAVAGSTAVLFMLARFLGALALLLHRR